MRDRTVFLFFDNLWILFTLLGEGFGKDCREGCVTIPVLKFKPGLKFVGDCSATEYRTKNQNKDKGKTQYIVEEG